MGTSLNYTVWKKHKGKGGPLKHHLPWPASVDSGSYPECPSLAPGTQKGILALKEQIPDY